MIELRIIDENNYEQCFTLKASVKNESFVDSVIYSLAEAWVFYKDTRPFAIYDGNQMIGFVSIYIGEDNYQIINFLIDDHFQKEHGAKRVSVPVELKNEIAQRFWSRLGFVFSDTVEDGYVFMRLYLK